MATPLPCHLLTPHCSPLQGEMGPPGFPGMPGEPGLKGEKVSASVAPPSSHPSSAAPLNLTLSSVLG